jgi:PAS domain S-box-containing protein
MNTHAAPSILIVEDEQIVAADLQQSLDEMGYDAFAIAASAEEAVACASVRCPDVVLMDIRIKGPNDGIQTAAILKKRFSVIVIFLTAQTDEAMIHRAKRTEPQGYLVKPVKDAELRSMIEIAMYRRDLELEREKLREIEHRFHTIIDNVPVAIAYFDRAGKVQFANHVFRSAVPYRDDPVGVPAMSVLGENLYKESYPARQKAMLGEPASFIVHLEQHGKSRTHEVTYLPDQDSNGTIIGVYALGYDVTEREQLNADLHQARVDMETILNAVPAAITSWRKDLTNRFANEAAKVQFGFIGGESLGRDMRQMLGVDAYGKAQPYIDRALAGEASSHEQAEALRDGILQYTRHYYIPQIEGGHVVGLYALAFDITDVRQSHERIRQLAQRLETIREEERRAVAMVLHDGIAQDLFAMKLGLDHLKVLAKRRPPMRELCHELAGALSKCMENTRQVANDLRPVALAYFGVSAIIKEHARHFGERSNLTIHVSESAEFPKLDEATRLLLFRAAQEALTNVARHAHATTVDISLRAADGRITMEITDDGIGIADAAMNKHRSLGLLGLRERFAALGGGLKVERRVPKGTVVTLHLPERVEAIAHAS